MCPDTTNSSVSDYHDALVVDGTPVTIRTMRPGDRDIEARFVSELSPISRYCRFHYALKELDTAMLERFTHVNYPQDMALIATIPDGACNREIGVARFVRYPGTDSAEIAVVVADAWQGKGIGARLLLDLRTLAVAAGIRHLEACVLPGNKRMLELARALGFTIREISSGDGGSIELGKEIDS
jgi:acetyltransferase